MTEAEELIPDLGKWPASTAMDSEWRAFRESVSTLIVQRIKIIEEECSGDLLGRSARLRALRREHHLLIVGDRIRRASIGTPPADLRREAQMLLDKIELTEDGSTARARTRQEQKFLSSARVSWHHLIKKAGARAVDPRGGPRSPKKKPSIATPAMLRQLVANSLSDETNRILRRYIAEQIEQIVVGAEEVAEGVHLASDNRQTLGTLRRMARRIRQRETWE